MRYCCPQVSVPSGSTPPCGVPPRRHRVMAPSTNNAATTRRRRPQTNRGPPPAPPRTRGAPPGRTRWSSSISSARALRCLPAPRRALTCGTGPAPNPGKSAGRAGAHAHEQSPCRQAAVSAERAGARTEGPLAHQPRPSADVEHDPQELRVGHSPAGRGRQAGAPWRKTT